MTDSSVSSFPSWTLTSCFWHNLGLGLFVVVYAKVAVMGGEYMVRHRIMTTLQSRKFVHIGATTTLLFWPWYDTTSSDHWSYAFNALTPALYIVQLIVKGLVIRNRNDPDVIAMTRTGNPIELCYGPLAYVVVLFYVGVYEFRKEIAVYLMSAMGIGDGLAPIVGTMYPNYGKYTTFGGETKTYAGSCTMFLGTIVGILFFRLILHVPDQLNTFRMIGVATIATIAEAFTGKFDNVAVAGSVYAFLKVVG